MTEKPLRIFVVPDTQVRPDVPLDHLTWVGKAIIKYQPDVVVHLGDHFDLPSLSSHDKPGSKAFEGRRYRADVEAGNEGMRLLLAPLKELQSRQRKNKEKVYKPRLVYLFGNHDQRVERAVQNNPVLEGTIGYQDFNLKDWETYPFLQPAFINGVAFAHYFQTGAMGRPAASAAAMISKLHQSCVAGHQQTKQIAYSKRADGKSIFATIIGACYLHQEDYLGPQGNKHYRGVLILNEVQDGQADELFLSLKYLERKYGEGTNLTASL